MKRFFAVLLSAVLTLSNAFAFDHIPNLHTTDENVTFIVEVEGEPVAVEKYTKGKTDTKRIEKQLLNKQEKVKSRIKDNVFADAEFNFSYTSLFNGFSFDGKIGDLEKLKKIDGVKNVYVSEKIPVPKPKMGNAGSFTGTTVAYESGYSGKGQIIAIVDSFLDKEHEFFKTAPENPKYTKVDIDKLMKEKTLLSGLTSADSVYVNEKIPYAFNYVTMTPDTYSASEHHGTHVAGIAAGKNGKLPNDETFSGVAYDAQIMFMNAGIDGYLSSTAIVAALDDAAKLGADVINMSFGSDYIDSEIGNLYKEVLDNAKIAGICIASSAGNSSRGYDDRVPLAEDIDYSAGGTPACFKSVTSVASADNSETMYPCWLVELSGNDEPLEFFELYGGSTFVDLIKDGYVEYVYCRLGAESDFEGKNLSGRIALIDRGELLYTEKVANAIDAGAVGVIIANQEENFAMTSTQKLPGASVAKSVGKKLADAADKRIKFKENGVSTNKIATAGKVSSFSSWGVDSTLNLKPEITAPGGNIYSAYPGGDTYEYLSGTSMASPHMAGIYALEGEYYSTNPFLSEYNELEGEERVELLENLAMSSAKIIRRDDGTAYSPRVQGAGMVNFENLMKAKVFIEGDEGTKAKVSLKKIGSEFTVKFGVENITNESVTFDKISIELLTDGYTTESDGKTYVGDSVKIADDEIESIDMPPNLTVGVGETKEFTATVKLKDEFLKKNKEVFTNGFFVDGFVVLDTENLSTCASMPFTGFYGDWYDGNMKIFDTTLYDEGGSTLADASDPYTTGTFLSGFITPTRYVLLGANMLDDEMNGKEYLAYSNKSGLDLGFTYKNFRAISNMELKLTNSSGAVVYSENTNKMSSKFRQDIYMIDSEKLAQFPDGEYTFSASATALGGSKATDTLTLPLLFDTVDPEIVSAQYDETEKKLTLSVKDNHRVAFLFYEYDDEGYGYIPVTDDDVKDGVVTKTIDLSEVVDLNTFAVEVNDYAYNDIYRSFGTLTEKFGVTVGSIRGNSSAATTQLYVRNNTAENMNANVIVAFYDSESRLIACDSKNNFSLSAGAEEEINYNIAGNITAAKELRVFIWIPSTNVPLDAAKVFTLVN